MTRRRLPIGIQTFRKIREGDYYCVDKTAHIARLVDEGKHYVLSRPRRFGKSLLLDTLKELFEGNEPLFRGMAIHGRWDWSVRHPVLRLRFGGGRFRREDDVPAHVADQLETLEKRAGIIPRPAAASIRLGRLIRELHERTGRRVVMLVDDYDKPVLDLLDVPEACRANRDFLCGLYSVVKECDAHVHFTLLAGVGRFSTGSVFSGLNNLIDITLDSCFSGICGYTDADLDTVFAPELPGLDRDEIRDWYGGYAWGGEQVYNPFDILHLFGCRNFGPWWFEAGVPALLSDMLIERGVDPAAVDGMICHRSMLSYFDVDDIVMETLLFQTGCLAIAGTEDLGGETLYRLGYPNREVRRSLNERLLRAAVPDASRQADA